LCQYKHAERQQSVFSRGLPSKVEQTEISGVDQIFVVFRQEMATCGSQQFYNHSYLVAFLGKNCRAEKTRTNPRKGINTHPAFASGTDETAGSPLLLCSLFSGLSAYASAGRTKAAVTRAQTFRKGIREEIIVDIYKRHCIEKIKSIICEFLSFPVIQ
jgi:hypothetical protein